MPVTYDLSTDIGRVRLLISDTDTENAVFTDAEIEAFLDERDGQIKLAAASALRAIAGNAVQVRGVLTVPDVKTDARAETQALLDLAERYEAEVDEAGNTAVVGGTHRHPGAGFVIL